MIKNAIGEVENFVGDLQNNYIDVYNNKTENQMASNLKQTEISLLHQFELALTNAQSQPDIAMALDKYGYDKSMINQGVELLEKAKIYYDYNKLEDDETSAARLEYHEKSDLIYNKFRKDRKVAKIVFRKDSQTQQELGVDRPVPTAWASRISSYEKFYNIALSSPDIHNKLSRLRLDKDSLAQGLEMTKGAIASRASYYQEVGESEQATKEKNKALDEIDDWMDEFYMVAELALEESPQLMESLGKTVR